MSIFEAIGTTRHPDGAATGEIDGLVIRQKGLLVIIDCDEVMRRATQHVFTARIPGAPDPAEIEVVDTSQGRPHLRTKSSGRDELRELPIWDRQRVCWVNPLRPGGPRLGSPGSET
jgi:hypothetical protein